MATLTMRVARAQIGQFRALLTAPRQTGICTQIGGSVRDCCDQAS